MFANLAQATVKHVQEPKVTVLHAMIIFGCLVIIVVRIVTLTSGKTIVHGLATIVMILVLLVMDHLPPIVLLVVQQELLILKLIHVI